jgi:hypothetical protein
LTAKELEVRNTLRVHISKTELNFCKIVVRFSEPADAAGEHGRHGQALGGPVPARAEADPEHPFAILLLAELSARKPHFFSSFLTEELIY